MIKWIDKKEIEPYINQAKKEKLFFNTHTEYHGYYIDDKLVAFCGIMYFRNKAVLKNDYVFPEYRSRGICTEMIDYRLKLLKEKGYKIIEANCTKDALSIHIKAGAKVVREYKICTLVRYENI
jgi:hypothetical protein